MVGLDCERKVTTTMHTNKKTVRRMGRFFAYFDELSGGDGDSIVIWVEELCIYAHLERL